MSIKVCTTDGIYRDIVVCEEEKITEIKVCPDDGRFNECSISPDPVITSPNNQAVVSSGTLITITGGTQPYTVTYSGGSVTKNSETEWEINIIAPCVLSGDVAGGTIRVTDACRNIDEVDVRNNVAGGSWVIVSDPTMGTYFTGNGSCAVFFANPIPCNSSFQITINGTIRIREAWQCFSSTSSFPLCKYNNGPYNSSSIADCSVCSDTITTHQNGYRTEEWQCP